MSAALESDSDVSALAEEDVLRARFYGLMARLLASAPDGDALEVLRSLQGDDTEMGVALGALASAASAHDPESAEDEYNALFIGVTRGDLVPYGSFYLTGFLNEKPLAALRATMMKLEIERGDATSNPEDHIASVCEMMAGLINASFGPAEAGTPESLRLQKTFFAQHIAPWAGRFFADLEGAEKASLYRPLGTVGRLFVAIEEEAFRMVE